MTTITAERPKPARAKAVPAASTPEEEPLTLLTVLAEEDLPIADPESLFGVIIRDYTRPSLDNRWWTFSTPQGRRYRLSPDGETTERWSKTEWAPIALGALPPAVELFSAALIRRRIEQWQAEQRAKVLLLQAEAALGREALRALLSLSYRAGSTDGSGRFFAAADPNIATLLDEVRITATTAEEMPRAQAHHYHRDGRPRLVHLRGAGGHDHPDQRRSRPRDERPRHGPLDRPHAGARVKADDQSGR
ncbi:MAG TPA: hypothetical protein VNL77_18995 [Roseiflexaceae bacterium]|nr:hypothetical protein [Roseiflexaceae bacterium]